MVRRRRYHGGLVKPMVSKNFVVIGFLVAAAIAGATSVWERSPWDTSPVKNEQPESNPEVAPDTYTDSRDNQVYKTIAVNGQVWMAENLNYESSQSYCFNDKPHCKKEGRLYTWNHAQHICPPGTRLPTINDWEKAIGVSRFEETLTLNGFRSFNGSYFDFGRNGAYWTSEEKDDYADYAYYFKQKFNYWQKEAFYKDQANSVRCIVGGSQSSGAHKWGDQ